MAKADKGSKNAEIEKLTNNIVKILGDWHLAFSHVAINA
jgi:hypothetical protein